MMTTFMEGIDTSIAGAPGIAGSLSATTDEATWVLTSHLVANAVVLPASSWFSLSGMGTGMVFVPLATISVSTLRNEQIGNASGLFNLMRNAGGGSESRW